ncbi:hypothetical protein M0R45_029559 [Rubus argutus]|uniref:Uncharacterized protein n=1 Tax=Rubus argutus TaxID=59490 RepID=A0AAW1WB28_RUBAR
MLCWLCDDDFTFALDPFSPSGDNIAKCRFIKEPDCLRRDEPELHYLSGKWLGVCGGRLQMCIATSGCSRSIHPDPVRIWELKEEVVLNHDNTIGKFQWLGKRISLPCKDIPLFSARRWYISRVLSFYPNYENAIYMSFLGEFVKCKLSGGLLEEVA